MFEPYPMPQDYGARSDCKEALFTNADNKGFKVVGDFIFSIREFSDKEIDKAKHPNELVPEDYWTLNIDKCQRGVGSGACGPDTLRSYKVKCEAFEFELIFCPIS